MGKLTIEQGSRRKDTLTRTIRLSGEAYDRIFKIADKNNLTFNNVVNQLIEYALDNVEDNDEQ
ncbi:MAG: hypothetical protein J6A15_06050 [Clostridia bacterium]|nr:hypothetical protein [Clostridia bacterium]